VRLIELPENVGFGRALNLGVRAYPAQSLVFVNNDVKCGSEFIAELCAQLGGDSAMVAGVLLRADEPERIDSAGVVADRSLMGFDYLNGELAEAAGGAPPPLGPTGGAALFTLDAFNSVGGFDERMFAYYEDLDLALRLRRKGFECRLAAGALATHHYSATLGASSGAKYALTGWSRAYLLRRYGVMRRPRLAVHVLACEAALCAGQLFGDRTIRGASGRLRGWRAARGLDRRPLPSEGLMPLSLRVALSRRMQRRASVAPEPADRKAAAGGAL
jgi:GT2 family glycosyltransferase